MQTDLAAPTGLRYSEIMTSAETPTTALDKGADLIRVQVRTLPDAPGVYRMLGAEGQVLYVGKAKSLKKRVISYTRTTALPVRLQRMVARTVAMEFIHTHTEVEALLLEANLIKKFRPHYNVLLKDDKSYPYILITRDHEFPQVTKHRGARDRKGDYFGPFASNWAVNRTIATLQRAFLLRNCTDSYFAQRKRPCLQYHIKRCTAPCVGYVTPGEYAAQLGEASDFLAGRSTQIQERLAKSMQEASDRRDFETAAKYRDRIRALTAVQAHQEISVGIEEDVDVIALARQQDVICVQVFFFRGGQNFGNRAFFPVHAADEDAEAVLSAFVMQFYEGREAPQEILLSQKLGEARLLSAALSSREYQLRRVELGCPQRGLKTRLVEFALRNAEDALRRHLTERKNDATQLDDVAKLFGLEAAPRRIEVYDNSHISGTNMVGGMIVAGPEGFRKNAYRKFNIRKAEAADDYGMMREVIRRRFGRAVDAGAGGEEGEDWPDLVLIDGGLGQINAVREVLEDLGLEDAFVYVGIAKGEDRNAGREQFFIPGRPAFQLPVNDPALHYLQRLRDEAHRFAIDAHRSRRNAQLSASRLDDIPGIGKKRKKALLLHFGSARAVESAGLSDLEKVEGISSRVALMIYSYFHESR